MESIALLNINGLLFLLRWLHLFFGIIWIGHLYYFNFVQGAFFNETDASTKSNAIQKLVPRALWWFRYGALWTFITGIVYLMIRSHQGGWEMFQSSWGASILTGAILGTAMFLNVWLIIWPNQKIVIANATATAQGKAADPKAAVAAARAGVASRTNVLFSVPMLFYMAGARHLPLITSADSSYSAYFAVFFIVLGALEFNAIKGKTGPMTTINGVITCAFALTALLYGVMEAFI